MQKRSVAIGCDKVSGQISNDKARCFDKFPRKFVLFYRLGNENVAEIIAITFIGDGRFFVVIRFWWSAEGRAIAIYK
jgi:hypothetical protein